MLSTTRDAINAILKADQTINLIERTRLLSLLRQPSQAAKQVENSGDRILRRKTVAQRLGRHTRYVDRLAKEGTLRKVKMPNRSRAVGFLASEVEALIAGQPDA